MDFVAGSGKMITFCVYRWKDALWIDGKSRYRCGEILCDYLNLETSKVEVYYNLLRTSKNRLHFVGDGDGPNEFDNDAQYMQRIFDYLDGILYCVKPFQRSTTQSDRRLFALLNKYDDLFFDDRFGQFGADRKQLSPLVRFEPAANAQESAEAIASMNRGIRDLIQEYISFCEDVLRIKYVFSKFLDHYFHVHNAYPNISQVAEAYQRFSKDYPPAVSQARYKAFVPYSQMSATFGVLNVAQNQGEEAQPVLCEVMRYSDLGAFLTAELFQGIQTGQLPKRCGCCGQYFLLANGYYPDFCENIAPKETTKSCRDVGAKKKHEKKVKSDPVWLAHQRAYKTHYARYMKKKMTSEQFKSWSKFSADLRDRMLAEAKLPLEKRSMMQADYEQWLKE
jgi:hypothetical protein